MGVAVFALYGIPAGTPSLDRSYRGYFSAGIDLLDRRYRVVPVHFAGGATDPSRPELTEAGAAYEAFTSLGFNPGIYPVHPHLKGIDCREAFEAVARYLQRDDVDDVKEVTVFCAWTHKLHTEYLARKIFGAGGRRKVEVISLIFPHDVGLAGMVWGRFSRIPRLVLSMAAWHLKVIRDLERWLRLRHMRRRALYPEYLPSEV